MSYRRLPFEQYFIDTSQDHNHTGKATQELEYTSLSYPCTGRLRKLFHLWHEVNFALRYEAERNVIQIHFQKTLGFSDWFANIAEFAADYYDAIEFEGKPLQLRVHRGWAEMYLAAKRVVRSQWQSLHEQHPDAETEIIGWSLGSGQAMLCAQDLHYNYGLRAHVFTFGSVRPFRGRKADADALARYLATLCVECWNLSDVNDLVTYMPPFKGYTCIRRVDVQSAKRRLFRLLKPGHYHTYYDTPSLYAPLLHDAGGKPSAESPSAKTKQEESK